MGRVAANRALARDVIGRLLADGVATFCVCPGGRNAPLVEVLWASTGVEVLSFFDERSAGFFALGRARRDHAPVAVVTTSGTATAELLAPMVEAYYAGAALVAVTADRPRGYRGTGAPQSIEQERLYGVYAPQFLDLDAPGEAWALDVSAPVHLNVCFDEPLLDGDGPGGALCPPPLATPAPRSDVDPSQAAVVSAFLDRARSPLVIVGSLDAEDDRGAVVRFCRALGAPVLPEAGAGVGPLVDRLVLRSGDAAAARGFAVGAFDAVIRLGDVPSCRVWRDLDLALRVPVLSVSRRRWRGLTRGTHLAAAPHRALPLPGAASVPALPELLAWDRHLAAVTGGLLDRYPDSEPALVRRLSAVIPAGSFVYLGNSLPIREWTRFAGPDRGFSIGESRGANGIDGQVSTFLGWARPGADNWALLGDLTALYDLSALWALRHLEGLRLRIVVMNNGGGRIFERMFSDGRFQNRHHVGFEAWGGLWGVACHVGGVADPAEDVALLELRPDDRQTQAFWDSLAAESRA